MPLEVRHYVNASGADVFAEWFVALADRQVQARIQGVWELRIDWGPGYRVYYARAGERIVLLLCGGDKRKQ